MTHYYKIDGRYDEDTFMFCGEMSCAVVKGELK